MVAILTTAIGFAMTEALSTPEAKPPSYSVQLLLEGRDCLVVGAGNVAVRKVAGLLDAGAIVTVVAPLVRAELRVAAVGRPVTFIERDYRPSDISGRRLVITCTDDPAVNARVYLDGEAAGVLVNSADDPVNCAFTLPSVVRRGDLTITASTAGRSPALSMWLRRRFELEFDERWSGLLDLLADIRTQAREAFGTSEISGWMEAMDAGAVDMVLAGDTDAARAQLRRALGLDDLVEVSA